MNYQQQIPQYGQQQQIPQYGQQQVPQYGQQQQIPQYGQQQIPQYGQQQIPQYGQQQIPQYGQQQIPQYGQQQPYQQQLQFTPPPDFKLLSRGQGIDDNEYKAIISSASNAFNARMNPLSNAVARLIKQMIGGEWFVFVCPVGVVDYDFCLSVVTGGDFLSFSINKLHFQVCRLSN